MAPTTTKPNPPLPFTQSRRLRSSSRKKNLDDIENVENVPTLKGLKSPGKKRNDIAARNSGLKKNAIHHRREEEEQKSPRKVLGEIAISGPDSNSSPRKQLLFSNDESDIEKSPEERLVLRLKKVRSPCKKDRYILKQSPTKSFLQRETPLPRSSPRKNSNISTTPLNASSRLNSDDTPSSCAKKQLFLKQSPIKSFMQHETPSPRSSPRKNSNISTTPLNASLKLMSVDTPSSSAKKQLFLRKVDPRIVRAKQALSTSVPDQVIGREKELEEMNGFLENALKTNKKSKKRSMYMSGPPGTGKTACLRSVLARHDNGFGKEIFFNCMSVTNSKDIFRKLALEFNPNYDGNQPQKYVEARICATKTKLILLVLDEIDQLDCKGQEILYSIFEWPYLKDSKLVLIGIANSLYLTDKVLTRLKLSENMNPLLLQFQAYTKAQIVDIITKRLREESDDENEKIPLIKPAAINFLAAKIANISGDVRKALDVCRRAIESAELTHQKQTILTPSKSKTCIQIDLPQVAKIFTQVFSSQMTSSLQESNSDLPVQQKILLATVLLMTNYGKVRCKEVTLGKLSTTYEKICKKRNMSSLNISEVLSMCSLLESRGALNVKVNKKNVRESKLSLRIDEQEVKLALQDKNLLNDITSDDSCLE